MNPLEAKRHCVIHEEIVHASPELPQEILMIILDKLPKYRIYDLTLTSHTYRRRVKDPRCLAQLMNRSDIYLSPEQRMAIAKQAGPFVKKFEVSKNEEFSLKSIYAILQSCPNLEIFKRMRSNSQVFQINEITSLSHLKFLKYKSANFEIDFCLEKLEKLEELKFVHTASNWNNILPILLNLPTRLKKLKLVHCYLSDETKKQKFNLPELRKLELKSINTTNLILSQSTKLETLKLKGCSYVSEKFIFGFPNLRKLVLRKVYIFDDNLPSISSLSNLESLEIDDQRIDFNHFTNFQNLRELQLGGTWEEYTNVTFTSMNSLTKLKIIDVDFKQLVCLSELKILSLYKVVLSPQFDFGSIRKLEKLTQLNIEHCKLGDNQLAILGQLKNLRKLEIDNFYANSFITEFGMKCLTSIETFKFRHYNHYYRDLNIISFMTHLSHLIISSDMLGYINIWFLTKLKGLKELDIHWTDEKYQEFPIIEPLIRCMTQLEGLGLKGAGIDSSRSKEIDRKRRPYGAAGMI